MIEFDFVQLLFGGKESTGKPKKPKHATGSVARKGPLDPGSDPDGYSASNRTLLARGGDDEDILRLPRLPTPDERREAAVESQRSAHNAPSGQAPLQALNSARGAISSKPPPAPAFSEPRARGGALRGDDELYADDDGEPRRRQPATAADALAAGSGSGGDADSRSWNGSDAAGGGGGRRRDDGDGRLMELDSRSDGRAWEDGPPELEKDPIAQARKRARTLARRVPQDPYAPWRSCNAGRPSPACVAAGYGRPSPCVADVGVLACGEATGGG
jgi:hypothetical protein